MSKFNIKQTLTPISYREVAPGNLIEYRGESHGCFTHGEFYPVLKKFAGGFYTLDNDKDLMKINHDSIQGWVFYRVSDDVDEEEPEDILVGGGRIPSSDILSEEA